jgi:alcohol dehydrogenase (cytochrome c)
VPGPGEAGHDTWPGNTWQTGGAAPWMHGSYDPELNLLYWGIGQAYPVHDGAARKGDNLYSDSVVALDPETGKLRWHFQFTPNDVWDFDGVNENIPIEIQYGGLTRKVVVHADKNGFFYVVDRTNGEFLFARPFVTVDWTTGLTPTGRPIVNPAAIPTAGGVKVCPGPSGGKPWTGMAYSPLTRWVYLPVIENCATYYLSREGQEILGYQYLTESAFGKMMALDPATGDVKWAVRMRAPISSSVLATAGGLVFGGAPDGRLLAFDDRTGAQLWSYQTGSGIRSGPIMFKLDGIEYLAVASGMGGAVGMYNAGPGEARRRPRDGGTLFVFRVFEPGASVRFDGTSGSP